jgi:hypothetical protein
MGITLTLGRLRIDIKAMKLVSLVERLEQQLQAIEHKVCELLDASTIKRRYQDPFSEIVIVANDYYWDTSDESQKRLQLKVLRTYLSWFESFSLLFHDAPKKMQKQITETHATVKKWIEKENGWHVPSTVAEAKKTFQEQIQTYYQLLGLFKSPDNPGFILVPDTNALIIAPDVGSYGTAIGQAAYTIVILSTVLSELDKLKIIHRNEEFRSKVESVIRRLKGLRQQGNMHEGVTVNKEVTVKMIAHEPDFNKTLSWLDPSNNDDRIIAATLEVQREEPSSIVILVSADINHQNKAEMANIPFVEPPDILTSSSFIV